MNKILKIILKIAGGLLILGLIIFGILYAIYNKPLPEGKSGSEADALAQQMLKAINNEAYESTRYLEWSFNGGEHQYKWDKENGKVRVKWDAYTVHLNLNNSSKSKVLENGAKVLGTSKDDLIATATNYFNNDSFWLVAPFKMFDKGTERSIVTSEDGTKGLLITYSTGGTTPGDSYLWKLLPSGFPESYQMWTKIIPIGGVDATWDDWQVMESGVFLPTSHKIGLMTLYMGNIRAYN